MQYRVETNEQREPVTAWFDTEEKASWACGWRNIEAHRRGEGGLYGVYDNEGNRVP